MKNLDDAAFTPRESDDPMLIAWNVYKDTPEFQNTKHWASRGGEHVDGSLWAAFVAGWERRDEK